MLPETATAGLESSNLGFETPHGRTNKQTELVHGSRSPELMVPARSHCGGRFARSLKELSTWETAAWRDRDTDA
jgi:hypothetical protein